MLLAPVNPNAAYPLPEGWTPGATTTLLRYDDPATGQRYGVAILDGPDAEQWAQARDEAYAVGARLLACVTGFGAGRRHWLEVA